MFTIVLHVQFQQFFLLIDVVDAIEELPHKKQPISLQEFQFHVLQIILSVFIVSLVVAIGIGLPGSTSFTDELNVISDGTDGENVFQVDDFNEFLATINETTSALQLVSITFFCFCFYF